MPPQPEAHIARVKRPVRTAVRRWYASSARDLPWRGTADPYAIWISEIVLQQTRVDQGTPYIARLLDAFPTVDDLSRARTADVLKLWEGLGYYSRARNLHKAAQIVRNEWRDGWPTDVDSWMTLPGIGRYTAGAIVSIAFGTPAPVLDGNVKRVLARLTLTRASVDDPGTTQAMWSWMQSLVAGKDPGTFNQGMMELGARICTPRNPQCGQCPISRHCLSRAAGAQDEVPVRTPKARVPHHEIVVGAIKRNGRYLVGLRPPDGLLGGLWEFPGGKVEPGETHERALRRELREELGIRVKPGGLIASVNHAYSHFKVTVNVYGCELVSGTPTPNAHEQLKWVRRSDFAKLAFPKANHKFLDLL